MKIHELSSSVGAKTVAWRKGRGQGTGNGKTGGRGHKGQNARAGGGTRPGFEGGQMPLYRRVPKRGFNNIFAKKYAHVNVEDLNVFDNGSAISFEQLKQQGLVNKQYDGIVILGNGELTKKLTVSASRFSKTAAQKIEAAGGKAEVV